MVILVKVKLFVDSAPIVHLHTFDKLVLVTTENTYLELKLQGQFKYPPLHFLPLMP